MEISLVMTKTKGFRKMMAPFNVGHERLDYCITRQTQENKKQFFIDHCVTQSRH